MTESRGTQERRRHIRIAPKGTVILSSGEHAQRGRVANLAEGGIYLTTTVAAPERLLGRTCEIELRLDGRLAEWVRTKATIVRIAADGVALTFDSLPSSLLRVIDDMSMASRARYRVICVVLVDSDKPRRSLIATAFRAVGCTVIEAATPLEAIHRLGEASFEPDLIAVADSIPESTAGDLRTFVERDHPRTKLLTINDDLVEPIGIAHWLSSADPESDLAKRIRSVLGSQRRQ